MLSDFEANIFFYFVIILSDSVNPYTMGKKIKIKKIFLGDYNIRIEMLSRLFIFNFCW